MGIQGLLPFLKKSSRPANLSQFNGKTAAIDAYCWLHKGAFSCAEKLVRGESTDGYVLYVMKQVSLLLSFNIKPILVLDGCHLPAKQTTELKRRENREKNRKKAKELLREGKVKEARECFQRSVDVTSEMAHEVIKACRARNVDTIVAPYEADAQLAYFSHCGIADLIITEDSDLVLFGCKQVLFKMDNNGGGVLVEREKLHCSMNLPRDKFDFTKFRNMCILSGCDYLPSLHGIGLGKACRFFMSTSNPDIFNNLCKVPSFLKMFHLEMTLDYRKGFMRAIDTILHQLVFDPFTQTLKPLTPYPSAISYEDMPYCGAFIGHDRGFQIALGNIDVQTGKIIDDYDPLTSKRPEVKSSGWHSRGTEVASHPSIWQPNYQVVKESLRESENCHQNDGIFMRGKKLSVKTSLVKRKRSDEVPQVVDDRISEEELKQMYSSKRKKTTDSDDEGVDILQGTKPVSEDINHDTDSCETPPATEINNSEGIVEEKGAVESTCSEITRQEQGSPDREVSTPSPKLRSPVLKERGRMTSEKFLFNTTRKNPFLLRPSPESKKSEEMPLKFSALARFTSLSHQRPTIVQSRYFKSKTKTTSDSESQKENMHKITANVEESGGKEAVGTEGGKEMKVPSPPGTPLKLNNNPTFSSSQSQEIEGNQERKGCFKWTGQLNLKSPVRGDQLVERSSENVSKELLTPPPSQESLNRLGVENHFKDKVGVYKGLNSMDSPPFPCPLTPSVNEDVDSITARKSSSQETKSLSDFGRFLNPSPKCRVSGLRKSNTPSRPSNQRQLNLKEMFAFRKEVDRFKTS